ncbi:hypothetical protein HanXRQr2_Chr17g0795541 [Helianthus annuus]|uniref:Uncharacterized protein n=1 Tax=Helianthus annuus TaxID=4232 RepID=A0A9K3DHN7_HELAN|nr:hypothetical protein HanXRQr2_Chr17g0795541 [Helianthus annuus]KAJ0812565.1 hypothetical protein HanPSC8_Chr17g0763411 [Helianthus annuus]
MMVGATLVMPLSRSWSPFPSSKGGESDDPKLANIGIRDEGSDEWCKIGDSRPNVD